MIPGATVAAIAAGVASSAALLAAAGEGSNFGGCNSLPSLPRIRAIVPQTVRATVHKGELASSKSRQAGARENKPSRQISAQISSVPFSLWLRSLIWCCMRTIFKSRWLHR